MKLLAVCVLLTFTSASSFRYDGYRVVEVGPLTNRDDERIVVQLADNDERINKVIVLDEHVIPGKKITLAVAPGSYSHIMSHIHARQFPFSLINTDLQRSFDESKLQNEEAIDEWRKSGSKAAPTAYLRYDDQIAWVEDTAAASSVASTFSVGSSYEGRDMIGIAINEQSDELPAIWIDSNIHAREWISSASMLYVIDQILHGNSSEAVEMRTYYRWYILPNANPDGYEFSWDENRMWRKTRSPNNGSTCVGTDPNRNWDESWGNGASSNPCDLTYHGPSPFSEVETQNLRDYLTTIADNCNVYISVHSYSQMWLIPWGGYVTKPADYDELLRVGNLAVGAIESVNGLQFTPGTPVDLLGGGSAMGGGSFDWTKAQLGITYSYSPELRPRTQLGGGFDIPPSNIEPSGAELYAGIVATVRSVQHKPAATNRR